MSYKKRENTSEIVYSAALDLHQSQQLVTRENLQKATGQKLSVIDDRIKVLVDDGYLIRLERGLFAPVFKHHETRIISKTHLPDGSIKIDIGDDVLSLTPHEAMILGKALLGEAICLSTIEMGNQFSIQNALMQNDMIKLKQQIQYLHKKAHQKNQPNLFNDGEENGEERN